MKAISEVLSTIIIAGTIIAVSLTVFYYSMLILGDTVTSTEFGYSKSLLINIASSTNLFLQGNSYVATLPSRYVGIGYRSTNHFLYINFTLPVQGPTVQYVDLIIKEGNPVGTAYQGPYYYNVIMEFHLVDGEIVNVYLGLNDSAGLTIPAANIVGTIYFANGTSILVFGGIGTTNVYPLYPLPITFRLLPGDRFEIYMNDNYNDNNYGDGFFPIEITDHGIKSYDVCWEGGGWYHYTWFIINNTFIGKSYNTPALYKPAGYSYPTYWYEIYEISFKPDNSTYYDFYYHQSDTVQYEISGLIPQTTELNRVVSKIIVLDQNIRSLYISVPRSYATEHKIIYGLLENGTCPYLVNNAKYLPCIQEYFKNGKTYVELDYSRIYRTVYVLGSGTRSQRYLVKILYLQLNPIVRSSSPRKVIAMPTGNIISVTFYNVTSIKLIYYDNTTSSIIKTIGLDEIIPNRNPVIPIDVVVVVKRVNVVLQ